MRPVPRIINEGILFCANKEGLRTIGMGGDGASQENYGLVWKDASTAIADYGQTNFDNGNEFRFEAMGVTTPPLWEDLAVYLSWRDPRYEQC